MDMAFLKDFLFRHSKGVTEYFSDAVRIYAFKGEEDARWAAIAAAKVAGKKQKKIMIGQLAQMASNVLKNYPNKPARKTLSARILSLQEEIQSRNGNSKDAREAEEKLLNLNEEYLSGLRNSDSSIFRRKHPKIF
jgi:hypothetical protein